MVRDKAGESSMGQIRRTSHVITFGTSESKEQSEISFKWESYDFQNYLPEIFNAVSVRNCCSAARNRFTSGGLNKSCKKKRYPRATVTLPKVVLYLSVVPSSPCGFHPQGHMVAVTGGIKHRRKRKIG